MGLWSKEFGGLNPSSHIHIASKPLGLHEVQLPFPFCKMGVTYTFTVCHRMSAQCLANRVLLVSLSVLSF